MLPIHPQPGLTFVNETGVYGNVTLMNLPFLCTLDTCDLTFANFRYIPTLGGNALFAALFGIFFVIQIFLGIKHKTWGYMAAMLFGLLLELIGYIARILIHYKPFDNNNFLAYLICLTIAPAFLSAAIYLCLSRIVVVYGTHLSWLKPRTYTIIFCACDFISLLLQAVGGGIAASTRDQNMLTVGKNIMLAGLGFQVFSLILFAVAAGYFAYRVWTNKHSWNAHYQPLVRARIFNVFLGGLAVASIAIFARSVYRCVELSGGFGGHLFTNDEVLFMILEGAMIVVACGFLTALHPGVCFQGAWRDVNTSVKNEGSEKKSGNGSPSDGSIAERGVAPPGRPNLAEDDGREYPGGRF